jgi:hypothetical protein
MDPILFFVVVLYPRGRRPRHYPHVPRRGPYWLVHGVRDHPAVRASTLSNTGVIDDHVPGLWDRLGPSKGRTSDLLETSDAHPEGLRLGVQQRGLVGRRQTLGFQHRRREGEPLDAAEWPRSVEDAHAREVAPTGRIEAVALDEKEVQ